MRLKYGLISLTLFLVPFFLAPNLLWGAEIWVPPTLETADTTVGNLTVKDPNKYNPNNPLAVTTKGNTHFTFTVPDDFAAIESAKILVVGKVTKEKVVFVLRLQILESGEGGNVADKPETITVQANLTEDSLTEIDILDRLRKFIDQDNAGKSVISLYFKPKVAGDAENLHVVGLRFSYTGPLNWKGRYSSDGTVYSRGDVVYYDDTDDGGEITSYVLRKKDSEGEVCNGDIPLNVDGKTENGCWEFFAKGKKGDVGAKGAPGLVYTPGEFNPEISYGKDAVIYYNGSSYVCDSADGCKGEPTPGSAKWKLLSAGFDWGDGWVSGEYGFNTIVRHNGSSYVCVSSGGCKATDGEPTPGSDKWKLLSAGFEWDDAWNELKEYPFNTIVRHNGSSYVCGSAEGCTGEKPAPNSDKWKLLSSGFAWGDAWNESEESYRFNTIVRHRGSSYVCDSDVGCKKEDGAPGTVTAKWKLLSAGLWWRGGWTQTPESPYGKYHVTHHRGSSYVCRVQEESGVCEGEPGSGNPGSENWELLASAGIGWKGAWAQGGKYDKGEVVSHDGASYISLISENEADPANPDAWSLLAQKGEPGADGLRGPAGISKYTRVYDYREIDLAPGEQKGFKLACPDGTTNVLGGGAMAWPSQWAINATYPYDDRTWAVWFYSIPQEGAPAVTTGRVGIYAVCAVVETQ